jgi:glycosyltransferase involved in cell wall biosynthesis
VDDAGPPVDPIPGEPWADRERGFVTVGRIAPDNRTLDAVEIVGGVRDRGHDAHLHLVGSAGRAYAGYVRRVERAAAAREWVHLERAVDRDRLEALLGSHRYGLNAKPREHFGMAIAEYVAAGMVAFAPDSGGQVEVLGGREDRLFSSVEDAVGTIDAALRSGARPTQPRDRFDSDRFHRAIRRRVRERLAGRPPE